MDIQVFKDAMLFFLRGTPNVATVIPAMDRIDEVLTASAVNARFSNPVKAALLMGKKTLNHYYSKTNLSDVYRIAMGELLSNLWSALTSPSYPVLHPRHKLQYFKNAGWEDEQIETAEAIVRARFESRYKSSRTAEALPAVDDVHISVRL
jgi:hypothetical protein